MVQMPIFYASVHMQDAESDACEHHFEIQHLYDEIP